MWGKIIIPMYRLWLHGLYGLYGPLLSCVPKKADKLNLSLSHSQVRIVVAAGLVVLAPDHTVDQLLELILQLEYHKKFES